LSDNYLKQSQINTVVVQQKGMDRVGVEPTNPQPAFLILKPDEWQQSPAQVSLTTHCLF